MLIDKIVSGGQTGVDRAALDAAIELNITHGGWCPKGRKAEDGIIDSSYSLIETVTDNYIERTRLNVEDSDATLILYTGTLEGGTKYTYDHATKIKKPVLLCDINNKNQIKDIIYWIATNKIQVLNIAGPRESKLPGIYLKSRHFITEFIKRQQS
jgi:predicted Rossmann-fold nucleotide-binding protein